MKRFGKQLMILASVGILGLVVLPALPAQAATKTVKVTKVKRAAYHATKGTIYTSKKLNKVRGKAQSYQHLTLYVTKHATIKQNGKKKVYYYINTSKVKGWLWRGYLKSGKATPAVATMNAAMAKRFVKQANIYRAAKGIAPLRLDSTRVKMLKTHASWLTVGKNAETKVNWKAYDQETAKLGLPTDSNVMEIGSTSSKADLKNSQRLSQATIDFYMITGHNQPDYTQTVLRATTTKIGIYWFDNHGTVWFILLSD
ncbi:MAG: CAP domain-containing protein [Levilactobacillus sp.]|jgi:hypothetical protein|uniref:hypothetical protein n=1 Tax=Levilactobacillus sp. TaxID=2767919 RepID=UPI002582B2C4|nr:hypothetical protein [Levilactobacillus sp.]MCI1553071.1 CAP domain-containing protein [Levilactobacillus sp.]MCI1598726.1 CAP domain-containing protein [Levilactobacillus sp.]MCI1605075.1 CAP domain-containing protein [Levilactobacillus sp.]